MEESCFWEMYVPEALGYLTFDINTNKRLANGIPIKYHSISFGDADRLDNFERRLHGTAPGEVIILDRPPDVINVELFPDLKEDSDNIREMKAELRRMWKHGSLPDCPGKIVIPVELASKKMSSTRSLRSEEPEDLPDTSHRRWNLLTGFRSSLHSVSPFTKHR